MFCSCRPHLTESNISGTFAFDFNKKSCLKCPNFFREVLGPFIFGNNKIDKLCTTNWLQLKEETSFNCANSKHPMRLKAHRQNGDGCIWQVFPRYMLYVNYFFNNVKNGRVHVQGSAHYAPKIEYYVLSCRPEKRIFVIQMLDIS